MIHFTNKKIELIKREKKLRELYNESMKQKIEKYNKNIQKWNIYQKLNTSIERKDHYDSIIPLHLYTCWHTKELPPYVKKQYEETILLNPEFQHYLYDEEECRNFIKNHFDHEVLNAFDSLIPCSYKSDLWRYCILYVNGGIYYDIKFNCCNDFAFISLTENELFVKDIVKPNILTGLIVSKPKNEILLKCIHRIVENVKHKYYGENPLYPTGPGLLGKYFTEKQYNDLTSYFSHFFIENKIDEFYILHNNSIILRFNNREYRIEQKKYQKKEHYHELWNKKCIYHNDVN